jgi:hypothetical protein
MEESKKTDYLVIITKKGEKKMTAYYKITLECHKVVENLAYRKEFYLRQTFNSIGKNCWI